MKKLTSATIGRLKFVVIIKAGTAAWLTVSHSCRQQILMHMYTATEKLNRKQNGTCMHFHLLIVDQTIFVPAIIY